MRSFIVTFLSVSWSASVFRSNATTHAYPCQAVKSCLTSSDEIKKFGSIVETMDFDLNATIAAVSDMCPYIGEI